MATPVTQVSHQDGSPPAHLGPRSPVDARGLFRAFIDHVGYSRGKAAETATTYDRFQALALTVRDRLAERWVQTQRAYYEHDVKRAYYLSAEYLLGRALGNNLIATGLMDAAQEAFREAGVDLHALLEMEPDAGLGNGGLGRLAACFLDSMATLALPAMGYGLRYEYGIFRQSVRDGWQFEQPDHWLRRPDPWEVVRPQDSVEVRFNCSFELADGKLRAVHGRPSKLIGVPYDRPIVGYGGKTVNTL